MIPLNTVHTELERLPDTGHHERWRLYSGSQEIAVLEYDSPVKVRDNAERLAVARKIGKAPSPEERERESLERWRNHFLAFDIAYRTPGLPAVREVEADVVELCLYLTATAIRLVYLPPEPLQTRGFFTALGKILERTRVKEWHQWVLRSWFRREKLHVAGWGTVADMLNARYPKSAMSRDGWRKAIERDLGLRMDLRGQI